MTEFQDLLNGLGSTISAVVLGAAGYAYKKYVGLVEELKSKPTKQDIEEVVNNEVEKITLRFDYLDKRIDSVESHVSEIRDHIINAPRTTKKTTRTRSVK